jgi:hypothetical protein
MLRLRLNSSRLLTKRALIKSSALIFARNKPDIKLFSSNSFTNKVKVNLNMFCPMKCVWWNSEGLGDPAKHLFISEKIREHKLDFMILLETCMSNFSVIFIGICLTGLTTYGIAWPLTVGLVVFSLALTWKHYQSKKWRQVISMLSFSLSLS